MCTCKQTLLFGKTSLGLIPYGDWQAPQLLPLSTNTSQHQADNRYWHMKRFALIDLYLHLACFKFNLQGTLISLAIKYATYPAIFTWQHLMVQISFQWNPQLPSPLAHAFWAITESYTHCSLFSSLHLPGQCYLSSMLSSQVTPQPSLPWPWDFLCDWPTPLFERHLKQSTGDTFLSLFMTLFLSS